MIAPTVGLKTHIWNNNLRCLALLAGYPLLLLGMFWLIVWAWGMSVFREGVTNTYVAYGQGVDKLLEKGAAAPAMDISRSIGFANQIAIEYAPLIISAVAIWFVIAWFFNTNMIRSMAHSHPVSRKEEPELYNLLENLCISQGLPMPKLEIIESHARNAFASGISKGTYTITVTRGLMNSLTKDELEAVLAHELTHIMNRDVRLLIVTIIFTGLFGFLAQIVWHNLRYSLFYGSGRRDRNNGGLFFAMIMIAVILSIGYFISLLMRFALSRRREYMADAGAVELTKNPTAMMHALMRIAGRDHIPNMSEDIAMMCIENHRAFLGMFGTHPPIDKRIKAIAAVTNTPIPDETSLPPVKKEERFAKEPRERTNPWLNRKKR